MPRYAPVKIALILWKRIFKFKFKFIFLNSNYKYNNKNVSQKAAIIIEKKAYKCN